MLDARNATLTDWASHWRYFGVTQMLLRPRRRQLKVVSASYVDDDDDERALTKETTWIRERDARGEAENARQTARLATQIADGSLFAFVGVLERVADTSASWDDVLPLETGGWRSHTRTLQCIFNLSTCVAIAV